MWLRDKVQVFSGFGPANASLTRFFKSQAEVSDSRFCLCRRFCIVTPHSPTIHTHTPRHLPFR
jgi:hypothetical protein